MADKEITLHFQVDAEQAKSELAALNAQAQNIGTGSANGTAQTQGFEANEAAVTAWTQALQAAQNILQGVAGALQKVTAEMSPNASGTAELDAAYKALSASAEALRQTLAALADGGDATAAFYALAPAAKEAQQAMETLSTKLDPAAWARMGDAAGYVAQEYGKLVESAKELSTALEGVGGVAPAVELAEVKQVLEELLRVTKSSTEATRERATEERRAADSTEEKAKADTDAADAQRLLRMNLAELRAEYTRLAAAIREAAAAGDMAKVEQLRVQQAAVAKQMRAVTKEANISKLAILGQAQAAQSAATSIKSLADGVTGFSDALEKGELDVTSMVGSVTSLVMSFKALAGPIGWVMLAVQGLTMVWNAYAKSQQEVKKHEEELAKLEEERMARRIEANTKLIEAERKAEVERTKERVNNYAKLRHETLEADKADAQEKLAADKAAAEEKYRHARKMIQEELRYADEERKKELQKQLDDIDEAAREQQVRDAENAAKAAKTRVEEMKKQLADPELQQYLRIKLPSREEYQTVLAQIAVEENKSAAERNNVLLRQLQARKIELDNARSQLVKDVKAIDKTFMGGTDAAIDLVSGIQEGAKATQEAVASYQKEAEQADRAAEAARTKADNAKEEAEAAKKNRDIAEEQQRLKEQEKAVEEQKKRAKEEEKRLQDELNKEIQGVLNATKTTGSYAEADNRTRREILADDAALLRQREQELTRLLANEHLTEQQRARIAAELNNVQSQTRGLAQAQAANAAEARKWLRELQPPQLTATRKLAQNNLNNLSKAYARQVQQAERAAAAGNDKEVERWTRQLQRTANAMGRISGKTDQTDRLYSETVDKLKAVSKNTAATATATAKAANNAKQEASETPQKKNTTQNVLDAASKIQSATDELQNKNLEVTNALTAITTQSTAVSNSLTQVMQAVLTLSATISNMATAAATGFSNISGALARHDNELNAIRNNVSAIKGLR